MKRRWFVVLGAFLLFVNSALFVAFGFPTLDTEAALSLVSWMVVGILFVVGGSSVQIGAVEWYQLVGAGYVLMGITFGLDFSLTTLNDASLGDSGVVFAVVAILGGLSMVFMGVDWIRGGHHFEISQYEPGPILAFMNRNDT